MKCCGSEHETPFCPQCGTRLAQPHPLHSLLIYLRAQAKGQENAAENRAVVYQQDDEDQIRYKKKRVESHLRSARKFSQWADAVAELMAASEENSR